MFKQCNELRKREKLKEENSQSTAKSQRKGKNKKNAKNALTPGHRKNRNHGHEVDSSADPRWGIQSLRRGGVGWDTHLVLVIRGGDGGEK